jgi:hypothetical protein
LQKTIGQITFRKPNEAANDLFARGAPEPRDESSLDIDSQFKKWSLSRPAMTEPIPLGLLDACCFSFEEGNR